VVLSKRTIPTATYAGRRILEPILGIEGSCMVR
jgi:hypothetical protein